MFFRSLFSQRGFSCDLQQGSFACRQHSQIPLRLSSSRWRTPRRTPVYVPLAYQSCPRAGVLLTAFRSVLLRRAFQRTPSAQYLLTLIGACGASFGFGFGPGALMAGGRVGSAICRLSGSKGQAHAPRSSFVSAPYGYATAPQAAS